MMNSKLLVTLFALVLNACLAGPEPEQEGAAMPFYWTSRVKPSGWGMLEELTSSQQTQVDANAAQSPDVFPVPVVFEDDVSIDQDLSVVGGVAIYGGLVVDTDVQSTFKGPADFLENVTMSGGVVEITDGVGAFVVDSFSSFNNSVNFNETVAFGTGALGYSFTASGVVELSGNTFLNGGVTQIGHSGGTDLLTVYSATTFSGAPVTAPVFHATGAIVFDGTGQLLEGSHIGPDADTTFEASVYPYVLVPLGGITAPRSYTVGNATAGTGSHIRFSNYTVHALTIILPGGATKSISTALTEDWVECRRYDNGSWYFSAAGTGIN